MSLDYSRVHHGPTISAAAANRSFSQILREVRAGHSYVITAHGKSVARIIPCPETDAAREAAGRPYFSALPSSK